MFADLSLTCVALFGHAALWVGMINRVHAMGIPRRIAKTLSALMHAVLAGVPIAAAWALAVGTLTIGDVAVGSSGNSLLRVYILVCFVVAAVQLPLWLWGRLTASTPKSVVHSQRRTVDIGRSLGPHSTSGLKAKIFGWVPGNQLMCPEVEKLGLALARLPDELAGLRIVHISDLHMSGRVCRQYFEHVVQIVNELQPDLVALTGDICDHDTEVAWIEPTLGRLQSRLGTYYVLGNHDQRIKDKPAFRRALADAGCMELAREVVRLTVHGREVVLGGSARPWFPLECPDRPDGAALAVALVHTPDRFGWAARLGYDLVLAGHTHGGQICIPGIGTIFCPSWHGGRYASGCHQRGHAVMHVSRGTSSLFPLRLNCPPEITLIELVPARQSSSRSLAAAAEV